VPTISSDTSSWPRIDARVTCGGPIDRGSDRRLYEQLVSRIRAKIDSNEWHPGARIPSEHELMQRYGVARGTVRRAIASLATDGLLVQRHGKGTFVVERDLVRPSDSRKLSFAASLKAQDREFVTRVIEQRVMAAPAEVARELKVHEGDDVLFLKRVRIIGSQSTLCHEGWLNMGGCPGIEDADYTNESAFDAVERCSGSRIMSSRVRYFAVAADDAHADCLGCSVGDPLLALEQLICFESGVPVEWSVSWMKEGQPVLTEFRQNEGAPDRKSRSSHAYTDCARQHSRTELQLFAHEIRESVVGWALDDVSHPYHLGGSLSCADILAVLYNDVMHHAADCGDSSDRDRFVLSKGHAALALYPALRQAGLVTDDDFERGLFGPGATLFKEPRRDMARGVEMTSGSLGMGLAYSCGIALAKVRAGLGGRVFCLMGDGECNEGSVWEAVAFAGHNKLANLVAVVDVNGLQLDALTSEVLDAGSLNETFASFGFDTETVDGHDVIALRGALARVGTRPRAILARTVKSKGVAAGENRVEWHDILLDDEQRSLVTAELTVEREAIERG